MRARHLSRARMRREEPASHPARRERHCAPASQSCSCHAVMLSRMLSPPWARPCRARPRGARIQGRRPRSANAPGDGRTEGSRLVVQLARARLIHVAAGHLAANRLLLVRQQPTKMDELVQAFTRLRRGRRRPRVRRHWRWHPHVGRYRRTALPPVPGRRGRGARRARAAFARRDRARTDQSILRLP